ncbi:MAG: tripartite tricarboxylate transporter substrate binding protein [Firmicutes bacterium]|nr:tripartite tricarboxylate transporter substrate binding protein [Bacillota bacterium]
MRNPLLRLLALGLVLTLVVMTVGCTKQADQKQGEKYPAKRIELVVPYPPGGITDLTARALASVLPEYLGQPIVVANKAGGARLEGGEYVARSKPDGYTVGLFPPSVAWPELHFKDVPYQSADLVPVCQVIAGRQVIFVPADSKYASLEDVLSDLEKNPGLKLQFGVTGLGAFPHLVTVALAAKTGMSDRIVPVPLEGDAGVVKTVLGRHVPVGVATATGVFAQLQAGTVRALAITGDRRYDKLPDVPTLEELGYRLGLPDAENTLYVPKGTPQEVITVLEQAVAKAVEHKSFQSMADKAGIPVDFLGQEQYLRTYSAKKDTLGLLMKDLGLIK